ncbi:hypothetical protein [Deinococcus humi]|uniref:Uncharacterized protein n=1 Tax=Deinococcus humi TaxID=662880 RepID=A0A7W8JYV7_9DEIO|nr:hypothetical protein [Deinococcus humi]MBB5365348.1 hypothetical protein [Deinococcus humi]GGO36225.1 hypothetical protein GCM10008949_39820 [Deinococcus humi]
MQTRRTALLAGLALAPSLWPGGHAQSATELQDLGTAYALYVSVGYLRDTCLKRDPASAAKVKQAYTTWVGTQNLADFEAKLGQKLGKETLTQLRQGLANDLKALDAALQKLGPPGQSCPAVATIFASDTFNIRKKIPNLTTLLGPGSGSSTTAATGTAAKTSPSSSNVAVYSVAQLSSLMAQTLAPLGKATGREQDAAGLKKLQSLGTVIAVSGTTQRSRSITQEDDRRAARFDVYCYDMANDADNPPKGQVTVAGRVREFDHDTGITLENCVVLSPAQTAQLKKSTVAVVDAGWRFKAQPAEKFLVAAGQGLKDNDILGAYMEQSTGIGVGGMVLTTYPVSLFLKDGTVYNDPYWAPGSFNYKLSRQLEPQKWGRWTRQGNNFVIRWGDGGTETFEVEGAPKPLPAGTKLSGAFQTISGGGNTAMGGDVMVAGGGTYTFQPDGTFSGGSFGSVSSSSVVAGSTRKTGGTYAVSGYSITLKGANGQQQRLFFARYDQNLLYIGGSTYIPDR